MPVGRLTREQLLQAWVDAVDPDHARGVLSDPDSAAAIAQACEQFALVSAAAEETAQELYLLHGSGESTPPAGGAARSSVALTLTRTLRLGELLTIEPGALVEEVAADAGPLGAEDAPTGRRYALLARAAFFPGAPGPLEVGALAEKPGRGFDHPLPGSIRGLLRPGGGLFNDSASVTPGEPGPHVLTAAPKPDAPVPDHVGQTVVLTEGANAGQRRRAVGYVAPSPPLDAGGLLLGRDALLRLDSISGIFVPGAPVSSLPSGAVGRVLAYRAPLLLVESTGVVPWADAVGETLVSQYQLSAAFGDLVAVEQSEAMAAESGSAAWRIEDPTVEFGLSVSNALSPSGGRDATLDSLAWERGANRAPGEGDEMLRDRVSDPADAVSPLAVLRAANRALVPFGAEAFLLEAGRPELPGFYLDVDALDLDGLAVTPQTAGFQAGETVHQESSGASATAVVQSPAGLGVLLPAVLVGLARVRGEFEPGQPIFGEQSGASVAVPAFSGGLRPADRFRVPFSYAEARAFFLLASTHAGVGDFGFAWDDHPYGFFDSSPALSFWDGFSATSAAAAQRVWQAADEVRAGGVGFTLAPPGAQAT